MGDAISRPSREELDRILREHVLWGKTGGSEGAKAFATPLNLSHYDLQDANLKGANLQDVDFRSANLECADLEDCRGITTSRLAGAKLGGAKLPSVIEKFDVLSRIDELSKNGGSIVVSLVLVCAYCWLTILTTVDVRLLANTTTSPLPILGTNVPIATFYWLVPVALVGCYLYLHVYLQNLWTTLGKLPLVFPNWTCIDERVQPWVLYSVSFTRLAGLTDRDLKFSFLYEVLTNAVVWYLVPLTLIGFWLRYLSRHDWFGTSLHLIAIAGSLIAAVTFRNAAAEAVMRGQGRSPQRSTLRRPVLALVVMEIAFIGFSVLALEMKDFAVYRLTFYPDLRAAQLSGEKLRDIDLRGANASRAILKEADLSGANLSKVRLSSAELRGAKLQESLLNGAQLDGANLRDAELLDAHLEGADLSRAKLNKKTQLKGAHLEGADLRKVNLKSQNVSLEEVYLNSQTKLSLKSLRKAGLSGANLVSMVMDHLDIRKTNFTLANLNTATFVDVRSGSHTMFKGAVMKHATFVRGHFPSNFEAADLEGAEFNGTHLQGAKFGNAKLNRAIFIGGVDLTKADLKGARLIDTDLSGAVNLRQDQLDQACGSPNTKLPTQSPPLTITTCASEEKVSKIKMPRKGRKRRK